MKSFWIKIIFLLLILSAALAALKYYRAVDSRAVPKDGKYAVTVLLEGGSGRASVKSPCSLTVTDGKGMALIEWSSPYYDYMIVDGHKYLPVNESGNSVFDIPVTAFDVPLEVAADTVAMSEPHEITYTLTFYSDGIKDGADDFKDDKDNAVHSEAADTGSTERADRELKGHTTWREEELSYARGFSITYYTDGCKLIVIDKVRYQQLSADGCSCGETDADVIIKGGLSKVYMASTSGMDLIRQVGALDRIIAASTDSSGWSIPAIASAIDAGDIHYVGKYSSPDYEYLLNAGTELAIENTMIGHSPEVKEKLIKLGIPVLIERSSYESNPLGRLEWIKLYGALFDCQENAQAFFDKQTAEVENLDLSENESRSVAFFSVNSNGAVTVRRSSDYIPKMIEMAGGTYALSAGAAEGSGGSTMNMDMETFYTLAGNADILIYNSAIEGELTSIDDLLAKNRLFADFKAVKEGRVYTTSKSAFQETTAICRMILDFHAAVCDGADGQPVFLKKLE